MVSCMHVQNLVQDIRYYLDQPIITLILTLIFSGFCARETSAQANKLIIQ